MSRTMASPSPEPPESRALASSSLVNRPKIASCCSTGLPGRDEPAQLPVRSADDAVVDPQDDRDLGPRPALRGLLRRELGEIDVDRLAWLAGVEAREQQEIGGPALDALDVGQRLAAQFGGRYRVDLQPGPQDGERAAQLVRGVVPRHPREPEIRCDTVSAPGAPAGQCVIALPAWPVGPEDSFERSARIEPGGPDEPGWHETKRFPACADDRVPEVAPRR